MGLVSYWNFAAGALRDCGATTDLAVDKLQVTWALGIAVAGAVLGSGLVRGVFAHAVEVAVLVLLRHRRFSLRGGGGVAREKETNAYPPSSSMETK